MTTAKTVPMFTGLRSLCNSVVICALTLTSTLVFAAETERGDVDAAANSGPLSEFYMPANKKHATPQIAGDKKTGAEDAGTRKGKAKLVAAANSVLGGSGGKGKNKEATDENQADAKTDSSTAQAPATNEAAPVETPVAAAAPAEQTEPAAEAASAHTKASAKDAPASEGQASIAGAEPAAPAEKSKPDAAAAEPATTTEAEAAHAQAEAASDAAPAAATPAADAPAAPADQAAVANDESTQAAAAPAEAPAADAPAAPADQAAAAKDESTQGAAAPAASDCGAKPAQEATNNAGAEEQASADTESHWAYAGDTGPEHWAELSPKFKTCAAGKRQTPIDIESSTIVPVGLEDVQFNYGRVRAKVLNNGHTIQFNVDEDSSIQVDGVTYTLTQFHFHTPSEHTIDGGSYPMEIHLVHKDEKGNYAVVAILMEKGAKNPLLDKLWAKLPKSESNPVALKDPVDLHALLPTDTSSYRYIGSLTTPPCTEGVKWIVLRSTMAVTMKQFAAFKKIFPMNARPLQPINARSVLEDVTSRSAQASK
jgi:carbonic anhydrase